MTEQPWLSHYPGYVKWDQKFNPKPLYRLVEETAAEFPDIIAFDFMGKETSYADFLKQVNRMAKGLQGLGVGKNTHVGIFMPNCPEFAIAYFGILKAGGCVVNFSPLYSEYELIAQVEDSETDVMLTLDLAALYPTIAAVTAKSRVRHMVVQRFAHLLPFPKNMLFQIFNASKRAEVVKDEYHVDYTDLLNNDGKPEPVDINIYEDLAVLQYTGGTTGVPKGAMLTHANLYTNILQLESWSENIDRGAEIVPGFLPFFHVFSMTVVMNLSILVGASLFILPKFELGAAVRLMKKKKPTIFAGVPTMFTALMNHKDTPKIGMENVKICLSGGAPLPLELGRAFKKDIGVDIHEGYGLTETAPVATSNPQDRENRYGSIGLPLPGTEIIIRDREDISRIMPIGESGEICIRGPQVMKGYWRNPQATEAAFIDGMFRTGDVGYMDEEGYTYIIDRDKDLILVGGFNVYPRVVEEAIYEHPAVHEVTVIGIPDDYLGERPKAFVTLKDMSESLTEPELLAFIKDRLGKHEQPKAIEFRAELPKTMIGKLSKKELVAEEKALYEARKGA